MSNVQSPPIAILPRSRSPNRHISDARFQIVQIPLPITCALRRHTFGLYFTASAVRIRAGLEFPYRASSSWEFPSHGGSSSRPAAASDLPPRYAPRILFFLLPLSPPVALASYERPPIVMTSSPNASPIAPLSKLLEAGNPYMRPKRRRWAQLHLPRHHRVEKSRNHLPRSLGSLFPLLATFAP